MTNVTSKIIAGIDKAGNRGKGSLAGSHEVASHQGRIKEGRPVGKGWECAATEEEGQHRSNRLRIVWELTSRNLQAAVTDARTRLSQNLSQKFPGKVCLINGLWWILWFKSNALEVVKVGKKFKREISVDRFGLLRKQSSWTQIRSCQPSRKLVWSTPLPWPVTSAESIRGEKSARFKLRLPYQILYRFHCNFLSMSCHGYNAEHVTADMTAKWSMIDSYRRNERKCTCRIGVMAVMGFNRIEYCPFLLARERDAKARLLYSFCSRHSAHIKRERSLSPISWFLLIFEQLTSFSNFQGDF